MATDTSSARAIGLVLLAGAALPLQNLILSAMVHRGLGQVTALALNSAVGMALLVVVNLAWYGPLVASSVTQAWRWWFILPGLLGTFVVFVLLTGYTRAGAAAPTIAMILGQVIAALLLDLAGLTQHAERMTPTGWVGVALFVGGATVYFLSIRR